MDLISRLPNSDLEIVWGKPLLKRACVVVSCLTPQSIARAQSKRTLTIADHNKYYDDRQNAVAPVVTFHFHWNILWTRNSAGKLRLLQLRWKWRRPEEFGSTLGTWQSWIYYKVLNRFDVVIRGVDLIKRTRRSNIHYFYYLQPKDEVVLRPQEVKDWPQQSLNVGQITAVSINSLGQPVIFHRAERVWDERQVNLLSSAIKV